MHFSHVCEILHSEMYVKTVWNDVNPFTHIFTCSFTREFYVNLDSISHEFSPFISHAFSLANWMWSRQVHMLFHTYFKPAGYTVKLYIFTLFSSPPCDQHFTRGFTFFNQVNGNITIIFHMLLYKHFTCMLALHLRVNMQYYTHFLIDIPCTVCSLRFVLYDLMRNCAQWVDGNKFHKQYNC